MPDQPNPPASSGGETQSEIARLLKQLFARIIIWSERFTSGPHWQVKVFLCCLIFSVLFSGGLDYRLLNDGPELSDNHGYGYGYSDGYFKKIENPWVDVGKIFPTGSHDAKLNFRLTVPVVLHFLGVRAHWVLPALTIAAICANLLIACAVAFKVTQDRVVSFFVTLGVASTFVGSFGFIAYFDAIALAQLGLALMPGIKPIFKCLLVFTASFTDERAFVASGFLLLSALVLPTAEAAGSSRRSQSDVIAVILGMVAYCAARLYLMKVVGLSSPMTAVNFSMLLTQINFLHLGIWFALEGGWLLVALAILLMWRRRQWLPLGILFLTSFILLVGSFMVADVLRSASYLYPLTLVALVILADGGDIRSLRFFCFAAFVISAVGGNYNIFGNQVIWQMPLVVKILEEISRLIFVWL